MSKDNRQKKLWRDERNQLKKDLADRPKEFQYREKEIRFGGVAVQGKNWGKIKLEKHTSTEDGYRRKLLGLG